MTKYILPCLTMLISYHISIAGSTIMTVNGPIEAARLGKTLSHEHIIVDFVGADQVDPNSYDANEVVEVMLPNLVELKTRGYGGFVDCTPAYLGRDMQVLRELSNKSGLHILTNTGYYGAGKDKYVPKHAMDMTAEQVAGIWIKEFKEGIDGTGVRPGFIKTAVDAGPISDMDRKLIEAACITHKETELVIACHTGQTKAAQEVFDIVKANGVDLDALIIVHANGVEEAVRMDMARQGAWISLDGVYEKSAAENAKWLVDLKEAGLLKRVLISHDAGWYWVGENKGGQTEGKIRAFTAIEDTLVPMLKEKGFTKDDIEMLLVINPARAFRVREKVD